jgi:hypothetical protein
MTSKRFSWVAILCLTLNGVALAEPISQWNFMVRIQRIYLEGAIDLPFSAQLGDVITGTFTLDYADPGVPHLEPFIRLYPNQPTNVITASLEGVPLADAPSSFRHDAEVWNDSEFHEGHDLFFLSYQTLADPRFPGLEVSMSISGGDVNGLSVSNLNLPTVIRLGDFGGLFFGFGVIDPADLVPFYQLEGRLIDLRPAGEVLDADSDGVPDERDQCPATPLGHVVDEHGCSISQLAPCSGPRTGGSWKSHGQYVAAVNSVADAFLTAGLITAAQRDAIVQEAAQSSCGKRIM